MQTYCSTMKNSTKKLKNRVTVNYFLDTSLLGNEFLKRSMSRTPITSCDPNIMLTHETDRSELNVAYINTPTL